MKRTGAISVSDLLSDSEIKAAKAYCEPLADTFEGQKSIIGSAGNPNSPHHKECADYLFIKGFGIFVSQLSKRFFHGIPTWRMNRDEVYDLMVRIYMALRNSPDAFEDFTSKRPASAYDSFNPDFFDPERTDDLIGKFLYRFQQAFISMIARYEMQDKAHRDKLMDNLSESSEYVSDDLEESIGREMDWNYLVGRISGKDPELADFMRSAVEDRLNKEELLEKYGWSADKYSRMMAKARDYAKAYEMRA